MGRFKAAKAVFYIIEIFLEVKNFNDADSNASPWLHYPDLVTKSSERAKKKYLENMSDRRPAQRTESGTLNGVIGEIPASRSQYQPELQSTLYERSIFNLTQHIHKQVTPRCVPKIMINISRKGKF
ncbi:hypothetical protein M9H77_26862 [Catharanthus roseus]|uniref:Uncharacterized protein n=1 Tax=Catharanthus roseus TaxID=4058 RepID=A0ACC0ABR4_CATRO|nr:hypothetical protein M9H77_26862 [Catharanthus roseus]